MPLSLVVHPGVDSAFIAWRGPFIAECRGFALTRRIRRAAGSAPSPNATSRPDSKGFIEEVVATWVGFAGSGDVPPGTRKPSTEWPIQKYLWSDFMVNPGDDVAYQVVPMVGKAGALKPAAAEASPWSAPVTIGTQTAGGFSCTFNRGIVASQWVARHLPEVKPAAKLAEAIATPGDPVRNFLAGPLRPKLIALLQATNAAKGHLYAALFELDDPEILPLIKAFGKRAHIVLANGAVKSHEEDENAEARAALAGCDVRDRMTAPRALAHNKFLVLCDARRQAQAAWTGSTNLTKTGFCTQANNALLIKNPTFADFYLDQWQVLATQGDDSGPELFEANAIPRRSVAAKGTTLWFTPQKKGADLDQAIRLIHAAEHGILFLMFNPGPRGTLLNAIIDVASADSPGFKPNLYVQGVVNQNPGTDKNPVVLFNRGQRIDANADVVIPAAIPGPIGFWHKELLKLPTAHAMVHSKLVVLDPYGPKPVVMTGSHNMGPRASQVNDENLVIIEGNGALASHYAGKVMEIYSQYRWRASVTAQKGQPAWTGLADNPDWQIRDPQAPYDKRRLRELDFWFGVA